MNQDYQEYCSEGAHCTARMLQITEQVSLRVFSFTPASPGGNMPIVIVSGLSTILESFRQILLELTRDFTVHYIETREKQSSQIRGQVQYDIETLGQDIVSIVQTLGLEDNQYALMGYSFGASAIADGYLNLISKPRYILFMQPTPVFHYPQWSLLLIKWLGVPLFPVMKPVAKWYISRFRINKKEDPEMAVISGRALDNADPRKLRNTIMAISKYEAWDKLGAIQCPTLIVATSKDSLHIHDEIIRMVSLIKNSSVVDLETSDRTHGAEMASIIKNFVNGASQKTDV